MSRKCDICGKKVAETRRGRLVRHGFKVRVRPKGFGNILKERFHTKPCEGSGSSSLGGKGGTGAEYNVEYD